MKGMYKKYLVERKIDFFSDYGYIGSSNAVGINNITKEALNKLRSPSSTKERDVAYLVLAILDEAGMTEYFNQIKSIFDRKLKQ